MSLGFHGSRQDGAGRHRVLPVMCGHCGTDRQLTIRSVTGLQHSSPEIVLVSYTCGQCGLFSEHPAQAADLSMVLARADQTGDVLIFGGHYIHCGRPMRKAGSEIRRLSAPLSTEGTDADSLDVYLATRVLRCDCGFQMELPE